MTTSDGLVEFLDFTNEIFSAAIVIMASSMLLYNLVRNVHDRVTRASAALLGCVTMAYLADSFVGLDPQPSALEAWYRVQWVGIAYMPAAMFHLADALLSTTGRPSRGRRRRVVRVLYILSTVFLILAAFTDTIVSELVTKPVSYLTAGSLFPVYALYFAVASFVSMQLVWRARERCLTTTTRRRMTFLLTVYLTPGLGIFPYSLLFDIIGNGKAVPLTPLMLVFNLANLLVIIMLGFMSYPLSFFGSNKPDRLIKTDLLQFLLRGPLTANVLLAVMVSVLRLSNILGVKGEDFVIIAVIAVLLFMQWSITLLLPFLENRLIYNSEQKEARQLRQISDRLLTRSDISQLEEAILVAMCDQFQSPTAFIAAINADGASLDQLVGEFPDEASEIALQNLEDLHPEDLQQYNDIYLWQSFWLFPLRSVEQPTDAPLIGILGMWANKPIPDFNDEEEEILYTLVDRAARVLSDQLLQTQIVNTLNEFATNIDNMRQFGSVSRYGHIQQETLENSDRYIDWVRGALRDFWGGPKLAESELMQLQVVQSELKNNSGSPTRALQSVLTNAIQSLKPQGERSMTTPEWILYNILEMRYLQGKKVRDVAPQLAMSEPDLYRKQRIAIEEVARRISEMERLQLETQETPPETDNLQAESHH